MSDYYSDYGNVSGGDTVEDITNGIDELNSSLQYLGSTYAGYKGSKANRQLQWDMMQYQLDWNSPVNQVARRRAAGLSPYQGNAISSGNLDSLPDMGQDPLQAVSEGLSRSAAAAIQRISSRTAVKEAKLQALKVEQEYRRLLMAEDLYPLQRKIVTENARTAFLTNNFLSSSMQDRLLSLLYDRKLKGVEENIRHWLSTWMADNGQGYEYYDEIFKSYKNRNSYYDWMIKHGDDLFDFQKEQADIMNKHWDILNNPFGIDVGSDSLLGILNAFFNFLRFFGKK